MILEYTDKNRGHYQYPNRAKQVVEFDGLKFGTRTPTDIDGLLEIGDNAYALFELKLRGVALPKGQELALKRIINALMDAGKQAALFIAVHDETDPERPIRAADAEVRQVYYGRKAYRGNGTLKGMLDRFIEYAGIHNPVVQV